MIPSTTRKILTSTTLKSLFKNKWAHYCASPHNSAYRHLYDLALAFYAVPDIRLKAEEKWTKEQLTQFMHNFQKLNYCWLYLSQLQQMLDDLHKKFHKMGEPNARTFTKSLAEKEIIERIGVVSKQMPPLVHSLLEFAFVLINWTDCQDIAIPLYAVQMARGDKLPFKVEERSTER